MPSGTRPTGTGSRGQGLHTHHGTNERRRQWADETRQTTDEGTDSRNPRQRPERPGRWGEVQGGESPGPLRQACVCGACMKTVSRGEGHPGERQRVSWPWAVQSHQVILTPMRVRRLCGAINRKEPEGHLSAPIWALKPCPHQENDPVPRSVKSPANSRVFLFACGSHSPRF